jgi:membrane-associated phospholipid phosphatase
MLIATVVTGNHFFVDGIAGALLAVWAFLIALWLYKRWPGYQRWLLAAARSPRLPDPAQ